MRVRAVLVSLGRPRIAALACATVAACALFVQLGFWQWHRHEDKVAARDLVRTNWARPPVPVEELLVAGGPALAPGLEWRPVILEGVYEPDRTLLARDRISDGDAGYEVLVPLRLTGGGVLLVDRGWVPAGATAAGPREVPAPPSGSVSVTVHLRPWQPRGDRTTPQGQVLRISAAAVAEGTGVPSSEWFGAYGFLTRESPAGAPIRRLEPPEVDLGPHLAYAVQWWGFAVVLLVVALRGWVRGVGDVAPATGTARPRGPATGSRPSRWARLTASGGTVDEAAEDAEVAAASATAPPAGGSQD